MAIEERIMAGEAKVCVIGLGYVGLPLLISFAKAGFSVAGIDTNINKIQQLKNNHSYITHICNKEIEALNKVSHVNYSLDYKICTACDVMIICVPTPLDENRMPDLYFLKSAVQGIAPYVKKGALVVIESTTYPGTTEEVLVPIISKEGKTAGVDYFIAYSPERVDPGNKTFGIHNTPKLVGGVNDESTKLAMLLYEQIIEKVIPVSNTRTAEIVKIVENAYRSINIAFVNELAMICKKLSIDVWEVIDAAASKPFGYTRFNPGPGVGGHCIPIDPIYLTWKLQSQDVAFRMIETAEAINSQMPAFIVNMVLEELRHCGSMVGGSNILILGVAYKKDINDYRESPALSIMEGLIIAGANISYHDPYINEIMIKDMLFQNTELTDSVLTSADCTVLITDHTCFDYRKIAEISKLIIDTRNAFSDYKADHIIVL